jgi:hypothetical protein
MSLCFVEILFGTYGACKVLRAIIKTLFVSPLFLAPEEHDKYVFSAKAGLISLLNL